MKDVFLNNNIKGVVFDLDSTLIDTYEWLQREYVEQAFIITKTLKDEYHIPIDPKSFSDAFLRAEQIAYKNGDVNFVSRFSQTITMTLETLNIEIDPQVLITKFSYLPHQLYSQTPEPFEGTLPLFKDLLGFTQVCVCTHSGKEWSKLKINYLKEKYKEEYGSLPDLKVHSIELDKEKDDTEWKKAAKMMKGNPTDLIAVGDSFTSDILPAVQAGYKYVVWITKNSTDKELDIKDLEALGCKITTIENINDFSKAITSNRLFEDN